ncbi:cytochrome-c oxidase, cbb3-type subunit III [Rhodospirillum sp. A1_3_36]|uniref:cytochrome-c oxidase, cbb3-type subunit III n=1 Tax=Rhodospirillum sp. A1_3_36 TaxID=3391666 RepID=UPI0039A4877A
MAGTPRKDAISGQSTTGHEWDGIEELNTPLPGWWVWVFYACILWAIGYMVVYPAIPLGSTYTPGIFGWHTRNEIVQEMDAAYKTFHADKVEQINKMDVSAILADDTLRTYAYHAGEVIFKENCAPCHQSGGAGTNGYPTLADDEWLWGGSADAIYKTVEYGIRDSVNYDDTRFNEMPSFDYLSDDELNTLADYIVSVSQGGPATGPGAALFSDNCAVCHASAGEGPIADGNQDMGGPALNNQIWLYSGLHRTLGDKEAILSQMKTPQNGVMPGWSGRLKDSDIKSVAVYVHSLGGGQ